MDFVTLQIAMNGAVAKLHYSERERAIKARDNIAALMGQEHSFKNTDRQKIIRIVSDEGEHDFFVDRVMMVSIVDSVEEARLGAGMRKTEAEHILASLPQPRDAK